MKFLEFIRELQPSFLEGECFDLRTYLWIGRAIHGQLEKKERRGEEGRREEKTEGERIENGGEGKWK